MAKTTAEKIAERKAEIERLQNQCKKLMAEQKEKERKARTSRLCKRMGLLEGMLPDTIPLTDEQFKTFLDKTVANDYGRRILNGLKAQPESMPTDTPPAITEKPAEKRGFLDLPYTAVKANTPATESGSDADDGGGEYEDTTEGG